MPVKKRPDLNPDNPGLSWQDMNDNLDILASAADKLAGIATGATANRSDADTDTLLAQKVASSSVTTVGAALISAATAAAGRGALGLGSASTFASGAFLGTSGGNLAGRLTVTAVALTDAATVTLDASLSNYFTLTLGGSRTLALTNMVAGQTYSVQIRQDATGGRTLTWPAGFTWPTATPGVLSTAANAVDVLTIVTFDGTTFRAVLTKGFG